MLRPTLGVPHVAALALLLATGTGKGCGKPPLPPASPDNGGLALPDGFEAVVVHDGVGRARHLAVTDDGIVYVKLRVPNPKGLVALRDTSGDGRADEMQVFGEYTDTGDYGTAMRLHAGHIYFTTAGEVYRQRLTPGQLVPSAPVETVLRHEYKKNLRSYEHIAKPIAFDGKGHMFVPFGAPGDTCQEQNRRPESPGRQPCPELEWQGGVWEFSDSRLNQTEQDGRRYATGIRSLVAMSWNRARRRALRAAARTRRSLPDLVPLLHPLAERGAAVRGVLQGHRRVRRRLAVLLLRPAGGEEEAEPGVRRRRPEDRRRRQADQAGAGVPRSLRAQRSAVLRRRSVPRAVSPRRLHRVPWLDDPHALLAGRLRRRVRAVRQRRGERSLGSVRRQLRRRRSDPQHERRGGAADGSRARARRIALRQRQREGHDLAGHVQGGSPRVRRAAAGAHGDAQDRAGTPAQPARAERRARTRGARRRRPGLPTPIASPAIRATGRATEHGSRRWPRHGGSPAIRSA